MGIKKKVIIVGGVAGGASCAARLRRLNEEAEIIMVERGPYVSFANCGLPYHISGIIPKRESLIVTHVEDFQNRFSVDTRVETEAIRIDREGKKVELKNRKTHEIYFESYDYLVLSPGAEPIYPVLPGSDLPGVYVLRNIPDLDKIMSRLSHQDVRHVTVIGAGFIGLETAENLKERGKEVSLVEKAPYVMSLMDPEMSALIHHKLTEQGIQVLTEVELARIENKGARLTWQDAQGKNFETDIILFAIGVKPEISLAQSAGLKIGPLGGISVDKFLRTSDGSIFAVGDAIETFDKSTGASARVPLAGPANRQGRLVADLIEGRKVEYRGTLGTSIVKVFDLTAASVGLSERSAQRQKINYLTAWVESKSHASYYPGAKPILLKILFAPGTGKILGAQSVGKQGVDKRIDVLATALYAGLTVYDLEDLDLAYAPPYSSAKDPVNMLGMVAAGMLRGDHQTASFNDLKKELAEGALLLDVREATEFEQGTIPQAQNFPLSKLREKFGELPRDKKLLLVCQAGYRAYLATRILNQKGFRSVNLLGGYSFWKSSFQE
jgi:NADPH-dependent 2,4-dienoyl-CoA reductase/sulfur reductase-like enzyme/rhodanese-related sulfurtransferase